MKITKEIKKGFETYEFPLSESEIESIVKKLPAEDIEGLTEIVITSPRMKKKNKDFKRFAVYEQRGKISLFAHLKKDGRFFIPTGSPILGEGEEAYTLEEFRKKALEAVLHEVGHHVGIKASGNYSEKFADDYADRHSYLLEGI